VDAVEEIKSRLSIEDVVGRYVDLKRSGASYKGLCPFHEEKTPSFYATPSRGSFHCFGCGKSGDIFSFVMEMDRLEFREALERLAAQAGVTLPDRERETPSLKKKLYEVNEAAARLFRESLEGRQGRQARDYLGGREFGGEAIEHFDLGYAPAGRDTLAQSLRKEGFDDRILLAAGLAVQDDIGGHARDRFWARLMFPIRDSGGRIVGFGGRALGDVQPKYLNSPQTEIFDKSSVLYGIHRGADAIRESGRAVLVEGYLDAVRAHGAGYTNVVASLGTSVTTQQLIGLVRLAQTVILALDPDPAGQAAAARTALNALAEVTQARGRNPGAAAALDLRIARLPEDRGDPDDVIRKDPQLWESLIAASVPAFDFFFGQTMESLNRSSDTWKQEAIDRLLPVIQQFSTSTGWQATWIQRLADETGIDPRTLQRAMPLPSPPRRQRQSPTARSSPSDATRETTTRVLAADPAAAMERKLIAMLVRMVLIPEDIVGDLEVIRMSVPEYDAILKGLLAWRTRRNYDFEMMRDSLPEETRGRADELYALHEPVPPDHLARIGVEYHLARLRHFRLLAQLRRATQAVSEMGADDESATRGSLAELVSERHDLEETLERLSREVVQPQPAIHGTIDQDSGSS
jgi:DNA primase